jgi:transcriptional regulator with XRE-family HTH domain
MLPAELKDWRQKLGLTQEEAARVFRVSRVTEQNWESGATPVPDWADDRRRTYEATLRRQLEYGPVVLQYWLSPRGPGHRPQPDREPIRSELFASNGDAIGWAALKTDQERYFRAFVFSEDREHLIFSPEALITEIDRYRFGGDESSRQLDKQVGLRVHSSGEMAPQPRPSPDLHRPSPGEIERRRRVIKELQDEIKKLPVLDPNFTDKDLYDENGLPK